MFNVQKNRVNFITIYHFYLKEWKLEYVIQIRNWKQALNQRLVFKNAHRIIEFDQKAWLKPHTDVNTELRKKKKKKKWFKKNLVKWMNNAIFQKTMNSTKKTSEACSNWRKKELFGFITKLSCSKIFFEKFVSNRNEKKNNKKTRKNTNIQKYEEKAKLCSMDIDSFIATLKQKTFT